MSANNRISALVDSQLPFFVRNDHQTFVAFVKAYFEYLEQVEPTLEVGKLVERLKSLREYMDVDLTHEELSEQFYDWFLESFPTDTLADKDLILKHVKDYYRARGTEKALKFLMRAVYNLKAELYYPKLDVLIASGGVWYIKKVLRISDVHYNGVANSSLDVLELFVSSRIMGSTSNAVAIVESTDRFFEGSLSVNELEISSLVGAFDQGETITTTLVDGSTLQANVFSGGLDSVAIVNGGTGYTIGENIPIEDDNGTGGHVEISSVSSGNIAFVIALEGGAGFQANDYALITGGGGSGANVRVFSVNTDEAVHPNSYNIAISSIALEAQTVLGNAQYSNLNAVITDPANNWIANSMEFFLFSNTGPILIMEVVSPGDAYTSLPSIDVKANTRMRSLGVIGRLSIDEPGTGYTVGDILEFQNGFATYGVGANGIVSAVDGSGNITAVQLTASGDGTAFPIGGVGYNNQDPPTINIATSTGTGGEVSVVTVLGDGEALSINTGSIGSITGVTIVSRGTGYSNPVANLTQIGGGDAVVTVTAVAGDYNYPGRWVNDDSHLSSFSFLEDRDYYQNFSYVVRTRKSLKEYKILLDKTMTPVGVGLFGEYMQTPVELEGNVSIIHQNTNIYIQVTGNYEVGDGTNTVTVNLTSNHNLLAGNTSHIQILDGDTANLSNGLYIVDSVVDSNSFIFIADNLVYGNGNVLASIIKTS